MLKELLEKRAALHSQMTAIVDKARAEKRAITEDEDATFNRSDADFVKLEAEIERERKLEARSAQMNALQPIQQENVGTGARSADENDAAKQKYNQAFRQYMVHGLAGMTQQEQVTLRAGFKNDPQAALSPATGTTGGYLIPQGFEDKLTEARKWFGGIDQFSTTITTETGNPLPFPTSNDVTNTGEIIGPNTQVSQAYPGFNAVVLNAYKFSSKLVLVPIELLQDSAFDFDTWMPTKLGERLARIQNTKFTVGVGNTEPTGLVTAAAAAGNVVTLANGNAASVSSDNLFDLEAAVDKAYRSNARYMLSDKTLTVLKKLKDTTGRPLWQPGLSSTFATNAPMTINGYEYVINNDMPNPGAGNYTVTFGDYTAFNIRRVTGYTVLRLTERYADYGQVGFLCFERADSNLIDAGTHPVALLQQSAT